jgi:hypothetical protein
MAPTYNTKENLFKNIELKTRNYQFKILKEGLKHGNLKISD